MTREISLQSIHDALLSIRTFVDKYSNIGNAHMVDYFVHDHWNTIVESEVRNDVISLSIAQLRSLVLQIFSRKTNSNVEGYDAALPGCSHLQALQAYLTEVRQCREIFLGVLTKTSDIFTTLKASGFQADSSSMKIESKGYMCMKKSHEVAEMSPIVYHICQHCETDAVLDIGSGKGYLSTFLTLQYDLSVTGVEANETNSSGANVRAKKYLNYWLKHSNNAELKKNQCFVKDKESKFNSIATCLDSRSDLSAMTESDKIVVTGLHACGDLCSNIISLFSSDSSYVGLCVVGCCYHHSSEAFEMEDEIFPGFPMSSYLKERELKLGRTKRMLALQAPEKAANGRNEDFSPSERSLFYRAVLNVIMKEELLLDVESHDYHVGKMFAKSKTFVDYIRKCLKKLNVDDFSLTDEIILNYHHKYESRMKEMVAFTILRQLHAPAIEYLMVLDRLCFLFEISENSGISHCFASEIFNPVLSPRRYAIIAVKQ